MKLRRLLFFLAVLLTADGAQSQQPPVALNGVVVETVTNRPMPRVSLELRPLAPPPVPGAPPVPSPPPSAPVTGTRYPGMTNENGQFAFRNIPPGRYTLTASKNGFVHTDYGQRGPNGKSMILTVSAGGQLPNIQLFMTPAGALSGHVYDSKGDPYPYVQMHARRITYPAGQRTLTITGSTYTDDLGAYRIYGLPPGQYLLSAEGETPNQGILPVAASLAPPLPGAVVIQGIGGSMGYTADPANQRKPANRSSNPGNPVYFRAANNDRDALPIDLRPGEDLQGMDITFAITPRVDVTFSGMSNSPNFILTISPNAMTLRGSSPNNMPRVVLPVGSYVAAATGTGGPETSNRALAGYVAFDANPSNPPNVNVALNSPVSVSGRIVLDGSQNADADFAKVRIRLRRNPSIPGIPVPTVSTTSSGAFTAQIPIEGDYVIEVLELPDSLRERYLKSENVIHVSGQALNDVAIVLGAKAGQIEGTALGETKVAMSNVTVILLPDQRNKTDLYKSVTTDASGRFRFEGIVPGQYKLFAWEDVEPDIWYNPEFMRPFEERSKAVAIIEGSRESIDLLVIPIH
jgi:protocatechuate 3,4-dioxygenase beta subunit